MNGVKHKLKNINIKPFDNNWDCYFHSVCLQLRGLSVLKIL